MEKESGKRSSHDLLLLKIKSDKKEKNLKQHFQLRDL